MSHTTSRRVCVPRHVWQWMIHKGVVHSSQCDEVLRDGSVLINNNIMLSQYASGIVFARLIDTSLSCVRSRAERMNNWDKLGREFARYGIAVDIAAQQRLADADHETITDALVELYDSVHGAGVNVSGDAPPLHDDDVSAFYTHTHTHSPSRVVDPNDNEHVNAIASDAEQGNNATNSITTDLHANEANLPSNVVAETDMLLLTLATSLASQLDLSLNAALHLLREPRRVQLDEYLRIGRAGKLALFDGIIEWVRNAYIDSERLALLIGADATQLHLLLQMFTPGLQSNDYEVALWSSRLLSRLTYELCVATQHAQYAWQWFIDPKGGLCALIDCYTRHSDLLLALFPLLDNIAAHRLLEVFARELPARMSNASERLGFMHELLAPLAQSSQRAVACVTEGVVSVVLEDARQQLALTSCTSEQRMHALSLSAEAWKMFPHQLQSLPNAVDNVLTSLREGCRESTHRGVQVSALTCLFDILDSFSSTHNELAPRVYKTLVISLIENYEDTFVRHYITSNLCVSLRHLPRIPVSVLLEPLVKQVSTYGCTNIDFDFFVVLAKHPALLLRHALLFMHLLGKMSIDDQCFARLASLPFLLLINRYHEDSTVHEYIGKYVRVALALFLKASVNDTSNDDVQTTLTIEIIAKLCHLHQPTINAQIMPALASALKSYQEEHRHSHAALTALDDYLKNRAEYDIDTIDDVQLDSDDDDDDACGVSNYANDIGEHILTHSANDSSDSEVFSSSVDEQEFGLETRGNKDNAVHKHKSFGAIQTAGQYHTRRRFERDGKSSRQATHSIRTASAPHTTNRGSASKRDFSSRFDLNSSSKNKHFEAEPKSNARRRVVNSDVTTSRTRKQHNASKTTNNDSAINSSKERATKRKQNAAKKNTSNMQSSQEARRSRENLREERKSVRAEARKRQSEHQAKNGDKKLSFGAEILPVEASTVLHRYRRPIAALFRVYRGVRPRNTKYTTFEMIAKSKNCMSHSDFLKLFEDMRVQPLLLSKNAVSSVFRTVNAATDTPISYDLITLADFMLAIWEIAHAISLSNQDELDEAHQIMSLMEIIQEQSIASNTLSTELWLDVVSLDHKALKVNDSHSTKALDTNTIVTSERASRVVSRTGHDNEAMTAAVTVMNEVLLEAFGFEMQLDNMQNRAFGQTLKMSFVDAAIKNKEAEREKRRRRRKEKLAVQLARQREEVRMRDQIRLENEEKQRLIDEARNVARQERLLKAREVTRERVSQFRKKKEAAKMRQEEVERRKKELERDERQKNIELYLKQKKVREEIHKKTVNALSRLAPPVSYVDSPAVTKTSKKKEKLATDITHGELKEAGLEKAMPGSESRVPVSSKEADKIDSASALDKMQENFGTTELNLKTSSMTDKK